MIDYTISDILNILTRLPRKRLIRYVSAILIALFVILLLWHYFKVVPSLKKIKPTSSKRDKLFANVNTNNKNNPNGPNGGANTNPRQLKLQEEEERRKQQQEQQEALNAFKAAHLKRQRGE